jgi:hypothetical protein
VKYLDGFFPIHADNQWQLRVPPFPGKTLEVEKSKYIISSYYLGGGSGSRPSATPCLSLRVRAFVICQFVFNESRVRFAAGQKPR